MRCWFLSHSELPPPRADVRGGTLVGHREPHTLASCTTICGSSVGSRQFSPSQPYCGDRTYGNEEIGLGLVEIDPHDLADSVSSIDQRPHVLVALAKLDYSLPRHQQSRVGRERIYDDDDLGSFPLLGESHILGGRLNLLEHCSKDPENLVKCVRRTDVNRL